MPPTPIVDDEVPQPPAAVAVAHEDELLQAVAVSAAAPTATANWIVRMRPLDQVFPFAGSLCSVSAADTRRGPRDVTARGWRVALLCVSGPRRAPHPGRRRPRRRCSRSRLLLRWRVPSRRPGL